MKEHKHIVRKPKVEKPEKRKKTYEGFDFFSDQLDAIAEIAKETDTSKVAVLRNILDEKLKLPKKK